MTDPEEQPSTNPTEDRGASGPQPLEVTHQKQPRSEDPLRPTRLKSPVVREMTKRDCLNCQKTVQTRSGYCPDCGQDLRDRFPGELITRSARVDAVLGFLTVSGLVVLALGVAVGLPSMGIPNLVSDSSDEVVLSEIVFILSTYILMPIIGVLVPVMLQRRLRWRRPAYVRGLYWGTVLVASLLLGAYAICAGLWGLAR